VASGGFTCAQCGETTYNQPGLQINPQLCRCGRLRDHTPATRGDLAQMEERLTKLLGAALEGKPPEGPSHAH